MLCNFQAIPLLVSTCLILLAFYIFKKFNIKDNIFLIVLILLTLITHLSCVFIISNPQQSDFKTLLDISQDFLDGNLNETSQNYINHWPYQIPFILYQTLLLKIFNAEIFLKLFNVVINIGIVLLMYNIAKKITCKKNAQIISILYTLFVSKILYGNILTNQFPFMLFLLLGINIYFSHKIKNRNLKTLLFGICTAISNLFRPEGIIIVLSFIIYQIYKFIKTHNLKKIILNILIFIFVYILICNITMSIIEKTLVTEEKNIGTLYKFVLGLDINSNGMWSLDKFNTLFSFDNKNDLLAYEKNEILKSFSDIRIVKLFLTKINIFWNDFDMSWTLNHLLTGIQIGPKLITYSTLYTLFYNYDLVIWLFVLFLAILGITEYNENSIFLGIILIVNFFVYLFIEVQGRYACFCRILVFILASNGIKILLKKFNNIIRSINYKKDCDKND